MALFYQQDINATTRLAIWNIEEDEAFFLAKVPLQKEITHPHKRLQHLAGRYLLRFLYPDFPNDEILVASTRKPFLPDEQYHFSISHCGNFAAAIVSINERVGIDIEMETPKVARIAHKFLNETETNGVNSELSKVNSELSIVNSESSSVNRQSTVNFQSSMDTTVLTLLWCAKETVYKWWGYGEVDFKTHIRLHFLHAANEGMFNASLHKTIPSENLQIKYRFFNNLCLAYTHG